jgi:general secretion pathway protein K
LQPLPETDAQALLQQRQEAGFSGIEEFLSQPMYAGAATGGLSSLLGESSKFFLLASRVEIADREQRLYSVLRREAREVDVLQRINASLYDMPVQELGSTR